jgi:cell wall-associated NlpC family hydrolase
LQQGDRLYFSGRRTHDHTGIYLGNGYFIHAGRSRGNVGVDHLSTPYYKRTLASARR